LNKCLTRITAWLQYSCNKCHDDQEDDRAYGVTQDAPSKRHEQPRRYRGRNHAYNPAWFAMFQIAMRSAIPVLMVIVAAACLAAITYPTVPQYTTATGTSVLTSTEIHPEVVIDHSYSTVICLVAPSASCYVEVSPYTATETRSGQIAETVLSLSASTSYVPYIFSGLAGAFALVMVLILVVVAVLMITRKR
jgi:hypothetical protein